MGTFVLLLGLLLITLGELLIGYSVLRVHDRVDIEEKIDTKVIAEIHKEKRWTILGMIFIAVGFLLEATLILLF